MAAARAARPRASITGHRIAPQNNPARAWQEPLRHVEYTKPEQKRLSDEG